MNPLEKLPMNVQGHRQINKLVERINLLSNISASGGLNLSTSPLGVHLTQGDITAGIIGVRRAITTEVAPAATNLTCNLYDSQGIEATTGDEFEIEVYCSVIGGGNLNAAVPLLEDNDDLFVAKFPFDTAGTLSYRWYCLSLFFKMDICT